MSQGQKRAGRPKRDRRERRMDRKDFGSFSQRLVVPAAVKKWAEANNKTLRFSNDVKGRISQLVAQDWDFVKYIDGQIGECESVQEMGDCYSAVVDKLESGEPVKGYLMCKEKDWYEQDQKLKHKEIDEIDEEIRGGRLGGVEKSYQPTDGSGRTVTKYTP